MKYPIGIETFREIIEGGYVYVDKTAFVYKLVTEGKVYFLSRPRRFGKSLLISTLESYFLGKKELFQGLKIDALEKEWMEYPVFRLSFAEGNYEEQNTVTDKIEKLVLQGEETYGITPNVDNLSIRFHEVLKVASEKTGRRAVVLVDEYDKPLLDVMGLKDCVAMVNGREIPMEDYNRSVLKGFYGVFKAADAYLKFVFLTGVTKFSQISVFSGFNQPYDISMDERYDAVCGITKDELLTVFDQPIRELAEKEDVGYEEMVARLKKKYDGYHFSRKMTDIFNPFSTINCFQAMELGNYWFRSGTPTYLVRLLNSCDENIAELANDEYKPSAFIDYSADDQQPLPMIYQSGYFTIKGYNRETNRYRLDFPNEEVREGFIDVLAADYFKGRIRPDSWVNKTNTALLNGDVERVMKLMQALLSGITYRFQRKDDIFESERYFHYTFYLILQMIATYRVVVEKESSEGRADCIIECPNFVYIIEFKLNDSAAAALQQIKDKGYALPYAADSRKIIYLGIKFSSGTGTVEEYLAEGTPQL